MEKIRVVTNSDLDAIVSAVLLKQVEPVGAVKFVPHEDIRSGKFKVSEVDVVVNLPHIPGCRSWFDHHASNEAPDEFSGLYDPQAPSAARVIYNHYTRRREKEVFTQFEQLLTETDRVDSADFKPEDIEKPEGAVLLSFIINSDPLNEHSVAENNLMISLLEEGGAQRVLSHPVFIPRVKKFRKNLARAKERLSGCLKGEDGLLILDFRGLSEEDKEICNNKFLPFVLYPQAHTLLRIKQLNEEKVRLNLGFNMFRDDTEPPVHYGHLLAEYGGGGHERAAGCAISKKEFGRSLEEIKSRLI
ncbi:MAG: hypothetical protein ACQEP7_05355 [bacterium]